MLSTYYYNQLNYAEQSAYNAIRTALINRRSGCTVQISEPDAVRRVWKSVVLENPEIIHYHGLYTFPAVSGGNATFRFEYLKSVNDGFEKGVDAELFERELDALVEKINSGLSSTASDYEVVKAIYDTLCGSITYDYEVLNKYYQLQNENSDDLFRFVQEETAAFTAYGTLINKIGVCQGLSKLFNILCDRFSIECLCVEVLTNDEYKTPHMMNVVEIDGERVYVDVTNGLPLCFGERKMIRYDFFAVSHAVISAAFEAEDLFECNGNGNSYFAKSKTLFYRINDLKKYLCAYAIPTGRGEIRCAFRGTGVSDSRLGEICDEIIQAHRPRGYVHYLNVKNGFVNAYIERK